MQNTPAHSVFGEITDFLASNPTPEEIITYRLPDELQERASYLLELNGEGELTPEEHDEMFDYIRVDDLMSLLKAKMKRNLKKKSE